MEEVEYFELSKNVVQCENSIGKKVEIITQDNRSHIGYLQIIDPESKTIILASKTSTEEDLILIPAHAIKCFKVNSHDVEHVNIFNSTSTNSNGNDMEKKKAALKKWLKTNLVDVYEEGDMLKYKDYLLIGPPYGINNCYCSNTIVLDRIQNLIQGMREDCTNTT